MNNCKEKDIIDNSIALKCTCTYQWSNHTDRMFTKNEYGNTVEDWELFVSKQKDENTDCMWICLIAKDKDGNHITQIDFDNIDKHKMHEFINDLIEVYKYNFK